jgi:hypothetical protein
MREEGAAALMRDAASRIALQSLVLDTTAEDGATCA